MPAVKTWPSPRPINKIHCFDNTNGKDGGHFLSRLFWSHLHKAVVNTSDLKFRDVFCSLLEKVRFSPLENIDLGAVTFAPESSYAALSSTFVVKSKLLNKVFNIAAAAVHAVLPIATCKVKIRNVPGL